MPYTLNPQPQTLIQVLNKLLDWLKNSGGDVGIFDATNTTDERRRKVLAHAMEYFGGVDLEDNPLQVLFIESICDDPKVKHKFAMN